MDNGAGDADELLLSAGELVGIEVFLGDDLEMVERFGHHALPLTAWDVLVGQRQVDVFLHGEVVEQVIALEDHADFALGQLGAVLALHQMDRLSRQTNIRRPIGRRAGPARSTARICPRRTVP